MLAERSAAMRSTRRYRLSSSPAVLLRCAGKPTRHRLKLDMNVRKTGAKDGIEGLAQSIHNLRYMHKVKCHPRRIFWRLPGARSAVDRRASSWRAEAARL